MKSSFLFLILLTSSSAFAEEQNKENTYEYLKDYISSSYKDPHGVEKNSLVRHKDICVFDLKSVYTSNVTTEHHDIIHLSEIDPSEIYITNPLKSYFTVEAYTYKKKLLVKRTYVSSAAPYIDNERFVNVLTQINLKTEREAKKVQKALKHLVKLCGGKSELF
jgi:hypothetical protein